MKGLLCLALVFISFQLFGMEVSEEFKESFGDISALITSPSLGDGILISSRSNQSGICKSLGYAKAAEGTVINDCNVLPHTSQIIVDENGNVSKGEHGADYCRIKQIICLNKISEIKIATHLIITPKHNQSNVAYSSRSSQNGVCLSLGYKKAANGSALYDCNVLPNTSQVIVDESGNVSGGDLGENFCRISQIVCI